MKKMLIVWVMLIGNFAYAQNKIDETRMQRDIEVAENILGTLIKQQMGNRMFFPTEVQGSYLPGYGVTFHLPSNYFSNIYIGEAQEIPAVVGDPPTPVTVYGSYSYDNARETQNRARKEVETAKRARSRYPKKVSVSSDSANLEYNNKLLQAAKDFVADYSDLITQLQPNEKIVVTNRNEGQDFRVAWAGAFNRNKRSMLSVEGVKSDVNQYRQGKITREQLMGKLKIVNSEVSDELQPDLELLSSIFNRLYSRDLSKTFFCDQNVYYERMKDFGAVYHMQVYASNQIDDNFFYDMPTVNLSDVDQATRDKKVKEMYPEFEKSIKEDFLEYGRTVKSLKDEEVLMLEIQMTRCKGCSIPSTLEFTVKNSVLKDYSSGKITKDAALAKISIKKGADQ
ncbi:hypothetical protein WSM22_05970 [Cytophagales bacterium WSM2-2]|nr:hypothetical protein WSM22_05970 [Cytophagales bacterium WSM2-2]